MKLFLIPMPGARCIALAFLPMATLAAQGSYNPAVVAADARWVVHADFNALRESTLGKELIDAVQKAQAQANGGMIGINVPRLLATIGTATAYGTNFSSDPAALDGTLVAQGTPELRKIAESALLQGTLAEPKVFSEVTDLPFPAYAVSEPKGSQGQQTHLVIAFPPEPIILVSKSKAQLVKAHEVYRGSAPSLAKAAPSPLRQLGAQVDHAYLYAASTVPSEMLAAEKGPQARILQLANSASLIIGERGPDLFAHARLVASSDRNAEKLTKILEGMTSMLSLAESSDKHLSEFLSSTSVTRDNDTITLKLAYPTARLVSMAQTLHAQAQVRTESRPPPIVQGTAIAEWRASDPADANTGEFAVRTINDVKLLNGSLVTVGRWLNGGRNARFDRVEITSAASAGNPLVFRSEFMRNVRGTMSQFQFPGIDGSYTLKVFYVNDPEGKSHFAVSVRDPKESPEAPPKPASPMIREPKFR